MSKSATFWEIRINGRYQGDNEHDTKSDAQKQARRESLVTSFEVTIWEVRNGRPRRIETWLGGTKK